MIFDISDKAFKTIFDESLHLPQRWDGKDFARKLDSLLMHYDSQVRKANTVKPNAYNTVTLKEIREVSKLLRQTVKEYFNGLPAKAYDKFAEVMDHLVKVPLNTLEASGDISKQRIPYETLFRAARVEDNIPYPRTRLFHTPYNLRSKVSTNRYSIAGFPSLYLGTSLKLCCDEIKAVQGKDLIIASAFRPESLDIDPTEIQVIDLSVKPQDFWRQEDEKELGRKISRARICKKDVRSAYLLWYPLIAACSFIRVNKKEPFAAEYIIPQLLMQWARANTMDNKEVVLTGIRYFSCASVKASDMGFNYVFPTSGLSDEVEPLYCKYLVKVFAMTEPVYLHEYENITACEMDLKKKEFQYIGRKRNIVIK